MENQRKQSEAEFRGVQEKLKGWRYNLMYDRQVTIKQRQVKQDLIRNSK